MLVSNRNDYFISKVIGIFVLIVASAKYISAYGNGDPYSSYYTYDYSTDDDTLTATNSRKDSLKFPIPQSRGIDPEEMLQDQNSLYLQDPQSLKKDVEYVPEEDGYYLQEKVGEQDIRTPYFLSKDEFFNYRTRSDEQNYFQQRLAALSMFDKKPDMPTMYKEGLFNRLFGGQTMSVKPQGRMELMFGYNHNKIDNPSLPERVRSYGNFDFDIDMNINLLAQVGDKLKLNISQNTRPSFGEQQRQKIEFTGKEDEVLKKIELGNINFPLNSGLINGVQSLYGVKTQLQFGRLWMTGVLSRQNSQRKSISVQGGGQKTEFDIKADDYDENRNFLLAQYFHDNYERALERIPIINSQVVLNRVEVWVTNRQGATQNVRDVLAFMDLGEKTPYQSFLVNGGSDLPDNNSNRLYELIQQNPAARVQGTASQVVLGLGLVESQDFHRVTMRKLNESEYTFHPQLGFVSLNATVNPDDVIAVSYRYTHNGQVYQVGEFSSDVSPDSTSSKVLFMKMLKGTASRPRLPIWKLMMKNVYSLGYGRMTKEDFRLNVMYLDPGGGRKRYLPEGPRAGEPIIRLLNLDNLNQQNDPVPDGVFDYVEGLTIIPASGKIIFPVLEPFGDAMRAHLGGSPQLERRFLFDMLYDSTKTIARQFNQNNRFMIQGSYKGAGGSEIPLGFNIPQGSVTVSAGGQVLAENVDYQVDYSMGRVRILNAALLNSGVPINISYEDNANFGLVPQTFIGLRADYFLNKKMSFGGTFMRLSERPLTTTVQYGYDPIKNTVAGLDYNYQSEFMGLTRALDKLPFYSTSAPSMVDFKTEVAGIFPGHHRFIDVLDPEGSIALDNFEGANSSIDIRFPIPQWSLASVPTGAKNAAGTTLFPESSNINDLSYGFNRSKIAWYTVDQNLLQRNSAPTHLVEETRYEAYWRLINTSEVFPDKQVLAQNSVLSTLDLSYFPHKRGPYNFTTDNLDPATGHFTNPRNKFGGIMRALDNNSSDFEQSNVEYITFWALDPFIYNSASTGGDLYINIGNVSEDVLKDGRLGFENGIPAPVKDLTKLQETPWGYVPSFSQQLTRVFESSIESREVQDVGFDGLNDDEERNKYASFLNRLQGLVSPEVYQAMVNDPASDNFAPYRSAEHDNAKNGIINRYENINNPQGNSPADNGSGFVGSITTVPESEDLNKDNSLNESESYFQYRVRLMPKTHPSMQVGQNNIVNRRDANVTLRDGSQQVQTWYQFKIPIRAYDQAVGSISDFRSIRFFRMFLTDFEDSLTVRFAQLQFDRSQWRTYLYSLDKPGEMIPVTDTLNTTFAVTSVSVEQNSSKVPVGYKSPPGVMRQQQPAGATGITIQEDERSMAYQICGLKDGDARAAFKEVSMDIRQHDFLRMFIHAESVPGQPAVRDNDLHAFVRIGSDFINNYYEYRIPLKITNDGEVNADYVWPEGNRLDLELDKFVNLKNTRNSQGLPSYIPYEQTDEKGNPVIVMGNPNLGEVRNVMIGVLNPKRSDANPGDDGLPKCVEVWFDELRAAGFNEKPGYAASAQANVQLADLGSFHMGGSMHTVGYGSIDQKVNSRFRDNFYNFDVNTNLNLGKLMPNKWGIQLPVYLGYIENVSNPEYDPYDLDVKLRDKLDAYSGSARDSVRKAAQTFTSVTSFSLNNFRIAGNSQQSGKTQFWSVKNFELTYNYNKAFNRTPLLESDVYTTQRLNLGYNYETGVKSIEPFRKIIKSKSPWLTWARDFNIKPLPSTIGFNNSLYKIFGETIVRNIDNDPYQLAPLYVQNFTWDRLYNMRWDLTKSLALSYNGLNQSRIDEPYGRINNEAQRDTLWGNLSRFGRNTFYEHTVNATYKLPTNKLKLTDWTNITLTYNTVYNWTAASMLASDLGHTITNRHTKQVNGELIFSQLYNRSRHLKAAQAANTESQLRNMVPQYKGNRKLTEQEMKEEEKKKEEERKKQEARQKAAVVPPRPEKKIIAKTDVPGHDTLDAATLHTAWKALKKAERKKHRTALKEWRAKKKKVTPLMSDGTRAALRAATMLKRISVNFTENAGTLLPGFMDTSRLVGSGFRNDDPWYDFAFGFQPTQQWIERRAVNGQFTRDSIFNRQMRQTFTQNIDIKGVLEPVNFMRIDVNISRNFNKEYNETFKFSYDNDEFEHLSPFTTGSFSSTFIGLGSFFKNRRSNYETFLSNRTEVSRRLGETNPYINGSRDPNNNNYAKGYTQYAQDVLIPAFIAAYGGRGADKIPLMSENTNGVRSNPFRNFIPLPNWRMAYNGFSKLGFLNGRIKVLNVTHGYTGTMNMNSFTSNLTYEDLLGVGFPSFIDSVTNNFVPFFQVPNITIQESFAPLLGVDVQLESGMSFKIAYNRSRMTSLNLIDYQISETNSQDIVLGFGHRMKGLKLPFTFFGITELKNDLNIRVDVAYRDDITTNTYFTGNSEQPTRGQWVLTITPRVEYMVNESLQVVGYYERRQTHPYVLNSYPLVNTKFGIKLIYLFTQ